MLSTILFALTWKSFWGGVCATLAFLWFILFNVGDVIFRSKGKD